MQLSISYFDKPVGSSNWEDEVSGKLGRDYSRDSVKDVKNILTKAWQWSRAVEKAAQNRMLAEAPGTPAYIEAERIFKRHAFVWKGANKLHRLDSTGKMQRSISAIRADAGDISCPHWLARQAHNLKKQMHPILDACIQLGLWIGKANIGPIDLTTARQLLVDLSRFRESAGCLGLDVRTTPVKDSLTHVNLHIIGAFESQPELFCGIQFTYAAASWDSIYDEMFLACESFGPIAWINYLIDSKEQRARSRVTLGCFYGDKAKELVAKAATNVEAGIAESLQKDILAARARISQALDIAKQASEKGDLESTVNAVAYAKAYAEDMQEPLNEYPTVKLALMNLADFDLTGLKDLPVLAEIRNHFIEQLKFLPIPKPRALPPAWQSAGYIRIDSIHDLLEAVKWVKGEIDQTIISWCLRIASKHER